ncbi:hypothetical protein [Phenylobacterium sp.]|uniref:hypothetical protein n=1 Tax=Phenylobacterium sp. TaxID=1871053 RepID=UPI002ED86DBA
MPRTTPRGRRRHARPAVFLASAVLHAVGLFLLAHHLSRVEPLPEARAVQLSIVTLAKRPARPERPRAMRERRDEQLTPLAVIVPARPNPPADDARPATPNGGDQASGGQRVLRRLTGCDHPRLLSAEERQACETRRWARAAPNPRLNLDLAGRYVENPEPYLVRKPKDGCKVRATGDVGPMGDSGHGRAGIGCAFSF